MAMAMGMGMGMGMGMCMGVGMSMGMGYGYGVWVWVRSDPLNLWIVVFPKFVLLTSRLLGMRKFGEYVIVSSRA
eukprot:818234-Amorphochlora_amoeboformis.AAC.1